MCAFVCFVCGCLFGACACVFSGVCVCVNCVRAYYLSCVICLCVVPLRMVLWVFSRACV